MLLCFFPFPAGVPGAYPRPRHLFTPKNTKREVAALLPVSVLKNSFLGTLADVKKAPETNNSYPLAYRGTVGYELCSKLKCSNL